MNHSRYKFQLKPLMIYLIFGMIFGILVLHPLTMVIYWFEFFRPSYQDMNLWYFVQNRIRDSFSADMLVMNGIFLFIGGLFGLTGGIIHSTISQKNHFRKRLNEEQEFNIRNQIETGENEIVEFKASLRWDYRLKRVNRSLENEILKSIAGFMNLNGGTLYIGIDDQGEILGLDQDYLSLAKKNADGFIQLIHTIVSNKIGVVKTSLIRAAVREMDNREICRIQINPSPNPVYVRNGKSEIFYLRTGNSTRVLNIREALAYINQRWS